MLAYNSAYPHSTKNIRHQVNNRAGKNGAKAVNAQQAASQ